MANYTHPTGIALYAALSEEIYRRNKKDLPINVDELDVSKFTDLDFNSGDFPHLNSAKAANSWVVDDNGYIYQMTDPNDPADTTPDNGFVARVVSQGDKKIIVFRGSDISGDFIDLYNSYNDPPSTDQSDGYDWQNNKKNGEGVWGRTQFNDALALTEAVKAQFGAENVVVTGQSLGGGLAGLVAAVADVEAYAFAPAPFDNQLDIEAQREAVANIILTDGQTGQHGEKFTADFLDLPNYQQVAVLENLPTHPLTPTYLKPEYLDTASQIQADFNAAVDGWQIDFETRLSNNLIVNTNRGEALTSGAIGWLVGLGAEQFKPGDADKMSHCGAYS